jgi:hypothetical protein
MRKLIVAIGCLLVFCAGWAFGQQSASNGTDWKTLSLSERAAFVMGFNRGHVAGMRDGIKGILEVIVAARPGTSWTPKERQMVEEKAKQIDRKSAARQEVTVRQIEAAVSTFYGDNKNTNVCWGDAILLSTALLQGNAPTEQELAAARKSGAESGCK